MLAAQLAKGLYTNNQHKKQQALQRMMTTSSMITFRTRAMKRVAVLLTAPLVKRFPFLIAQLGNQFESSLHW